MKQSKVVIITLCLLILWQTIAYSQIKYHYPIIFVHGLIASDNEFSETMMYLRDNQDFGEINVFDIVLNADNDSESALMSEDVKWEDFVYDGDEINIGRRNYASSMDDYVDGWTGRNFFAINFKEERIRGAAGTFNDYFDQSNEAAIFKQGYALNIMITEVLDYTGAEKVILVGHSMGGLAIREYLQRTDGQGTHTNWIDPFSPDGHKVARVVTFGTPHLGSNTSPDPTKSDIPTANGNSEANRDMLWEYDSYNFCDAAINQGIYMFGGYEYCIKSEDGIFGNSTFDNVDINCDGDEDDYITGINEGFSSTNYNPEMPLPENIRYTWLTSIWIGWDIGLVGDGAVDINRQWLYADDQPVPAGITDTCMSDFFHSSEGTDYFTILRGLDEPQQFNLAYKSYPGDTISGHITFQQNYQVMDRDMYLIPANGENAINIYVESNNLLDSIHIYDKYQNLIMQFDVGNIQDSIQIIFSEYNTDSIYLCVQGIATSDSWQSMYKVRTESAVCTGISEMNSSKIATIYPNPVKEILNVNFANHFEYAEISVLSLDGKCLLEQIIKPGGSINIADLDAGVYVLNIQSGMEMQSIVFHKL
jgi:triacylglycerol esterase/lipase EstA (alpha/beta hydrolase family)